MKNLKTGDCIIVKSDIHSILPDKQYVVYVYEREGEFSIVDEKKAFRFFPFVGDKSIDFEIVE